MDGWYKRLALNGYKSVEIKMDMREDVDIPVKSRAAGGIRHAGASREGTGAVGPLCLVVVVALEFAGVL